MNLRLQGISTCNKKAGGDFCSVTGGTMVVSDEITIVITSNGESFIDKMISLVEGAARQNTE